MIFTSYTIYRVKIFVLKGCLEKAHVFFISDVSFYAQFFFDNFNSGAEFVDTKTPTKRPVNKRNSTEKLKLHKLFILLIETKQFFREGLCDEDSLKSNTVKRTFRCSALKSAFLLCDFNYFFFILLF